MVEYGPHRQTQAIAPNVGFASAPYPDLHFGTGPYESVDIEVYAPGDPDDAPTVVLEGRPTSNQPGYLDIFDL